MCRSFVYALVAELTDDVEPHVTLAAYFNGHARLALHEFLGSEQGTPFVPVCMASGQTPLIRAG